MNSFIINISYASSAILDIFLNCDSLLQSFLELHYKKYPFAVIVFYIVFDFYMLLIFWMCTMVQL